MPKVVAMMVVRNEAHRYLSQCLQSLQKYVDEILVVDDHSTDDTPEICLSFRQVRLVKKRESTFWVDESALREECWRHTIELKPDWILAIDADEMLEESIVKEIPKIINQKRFQKIAFRLIEFWGSREYYRVDKLWNPKNRWVTNLIKYNYSHPYQFSKKKLHCGRLPINIPGETFYSKTHLLHYGYANPEEHVDKFMRYIKNDPYGENCPLSHYLSILDEDPELVIFKEKEEKERSKKRIELVEKKKEKNREIVNKTTDLIIVNYNSWEDLERCIKSIKDHTPVPHHIIVVDNNSTDGSREYLEREEGIRTIFLPSNKGYATAANRGIKEGSGNFIFIMNPDTIVTPGWLEPLIHTFKKNPKAGVVGPKLLTPEGLDAGAGVVGTVSNHHIRCFLQPHNPHRFLEEEECLSISGACYGIRRSLLPKIGLFDESFFLYFEETDYSLRVQKKGYQVIYCPHSLVYHDMRWEERDHKTLSKRFNHSRSLFEKKWLPSINKYQRQVFKKRFGVLDG